MNKVRSLFCVFAILCSFLFAGNAGLLEVHAAGPALLTDLSQLQVSGDYYMNADITAPASWTPIANFTGTLDGRGFKIKNLTVTAENAGLFKELSGTVKNLGFSNANITANDAVGSPTGTATGAVIAATVSGSVRNCYAVESTVMVNGTTVDTLNALAAIPVTTNCYYNSVDIATLTVEPTGTNLRIRWIDNIATPTEPILQVYVLPAGGGTDADPYILSTQLDFANVATLIADGIDTYNTSSYLLTNNLAVSNLAPIGTATAPFKGKFNGGGFILSGSIANPAGDAGLFGAVDGAQIENLGMACTVSGSGNAGGIIGTSLGNDTQITRCYSIGNVSSTGANAGGLVGLVSGATTLSNCYSLGTPTSGIYRGGLIGYMTVFPTIQNSYTTYAKVYGDSSIGALTAPTAYCTVFQSGVSLRTLAEMRHANFVHELNAGGAVFGAKTGWTPLLLNVGDGKTSVDTYQLTITAPPAAEGTLRAFVNGVEVKNLDYIPKNASVTIHATPANGFDVAAIKANGQTLTTTAASAVATITAPMTIEASFKAYKSYKIKVTANAGGTVTPNDTVQVREGAQQSFTIVPNSDCRIKSVTYSGSGVTVSGNTYTTGIVTRDETLTVVFISRADGVKDITVTSGGGTVITVKALENVAEQVSGNEGNTIQVAMDKSTVVDSTTLRALSGYNIDLLMKMKDYSWRINGRTVTPSAPSVNLGATIGGSAIDSELMKKFAAFPDTSQLNLLYDGAFPFTGYLTFKAPGKDNATKYATLFYLNESYKTFETIATEKVADDGTVTFRMSHASKYVVVVSNRPLSVQDLAVGASAVEQAKPITMKTTDIIFASVLFGGVVIGGLLLLGVMRKAGRAK